MRHNIVVVELLYRPNSNHHRPRPTVCNHIMTLTWQWHNCWQTWHFVRFQMTHHTSKIQDLGIIKLKKTLTDLGQFTSSVYCLLHLTTANSEITWRDWQYKADKRSQRYAAEAVCNLASHSLVTLSQSSALLQLVNWLLSSSTTTVHITRMYSNMYNLSCQDLQNRRQRPVVSHFTHTTSTCSETKPYPRPEIKSICQSMGHTQPTDTFNWPTMASLTCTAKWPVKI